MDCHNTASMVSDNIRETIPSERDLLLKLDSLLLQKKHKTQVSLSRKLTLKSCERLVETLVASSKISKSVQFSAMTLEINIC